MHLPLSLHIVQQPYHIFSSCSITIPNMIHHQQLPSNYCNLLHPSRPFCRSSFALCGLFAQESPNHRHRALQPPSSPNGGTAGQQIGRQARAELSSEMQRVNSSGLRYKFATDYNNPQGILELLTPHQVPDRLQSRLSDALLHVHVSCSQSHPFGD